MYHPRLKGTHYEMGFHYGEILANSGQNFNEYIKLTAEELAFGKASFSIYKKFIPEILEEVRGLADGSKTDFEKMALWLFSMYGFGNTKGCTCFSFHERDCIVLCRNSDMFPEMKKTSESALYMANGKNIFLGNSTSFVQMEDGINEHGLAIGINFLMTKKYKPGINTGFTTRAILENCKTTDEAIDLIQSFPLCSTQNFVLADKFGKLAVVEASPERTSVRKSNDYAVSANHFIDDSMKNEHSNPEKNWYYTKDRYETAKQGMERSGKTCEYAKSLASGKYGFICQYEKKLNFDTLWSSVYDISNLTVWRSEGNPSKVAYKEDTRLTWGIKKRKV
ncbi:MAG: C45 family peptidase [Eubacteriales bacterium]|nr:C45 family peptidase [Eubacteriales bacterium]